MAGTARELRIFPICIRELDVLHVEDVTPGMRRVVVGGPSMDRHVRDGVELPPLCTSGFDDDVKVLPVDPTTGALPFPVPRNRDDGTVDWPAGSFPYGRTYTVRRFDETARELTLDFAAHDGGLAATWSRTVRPGDTVLVAGPKHSASLPADADWMLLAGDDTALPAIAHCLETLPAHLPATVVVEVAEPSHRQSLHSAADVDITWLYRSDHHGNSRLADAVRAARWRPGRPYLWIAGEAQTIKPLRRWAKQDKQIDRKFVEITGYWRRRDVPANASPDEPPTDDAVSTLHEMTELATPLIVRAAVTVGVFAAVDSGATTADAVATECGLNAGATAKLLRHLVRLTLLAIDRDRYTLTDTGAILADQDTFTSQALHHDGIHTRLDLSFLGLTDTLRTGKPSETHSFVALAAHPQFGAGFHEEAAFGAVYRAPALPDAVDLNGVDTVALYGEGAGVYADTLVRERPGLTVHLVGLRALNHRNLADVHPDRRQRVQCRDTSEFTPLTTPVDLAIAVDIVDTHPDADAHLLLQTLASSARRVVLVTDLLDPASTDDHDTEDDLLRLCLHGSGRRTETEIRRLVTDAVGHTPRLGPLGWGSTVVEFAGTPVPAT